MNKISFQILPSPETNDHEIRILIDNEDLLGSDYLGIDPAVFFAVEEPDTAGELIIGRCTCGCEGCCDFPIIVTINESTIGWTNSNGLNLLFDKIDYVREFHVAKKDHSWEDIKRRVERLVTNILKNSLVNDNYSFTWASARIKDKNITLSYSKNGTQKLFELDWDGRTEADAEHKAVKFLNNSR